MAQEHEIIKLKECIAQKKHIYLIGVKGTGMCAFAELLRAEGARLSGSDVAEVFYTDAILKELSLPYHEGFDAALFPADAALVIHSAAWNRENNVELAEALRRGCAVLPYAAALGAYSALFDSTGIAGVHGKTTTTALAGSLAAALSLPVRVLAGSAIDSFGGRCTLSRGNRYFIAETCEYRRHFLNFAPRRIVLTSVESDHQDYYPDYASIRDAFLEYTALLPPDGLLFYCADDAGARETAAAAALRPSQKIPYGFSAKGPWRLEYARSDGGLLRFKLAAFKKEFALRVPGTHNALNAAAALALNCRLFAEGRDALSPDEEEAFFAAAEKALFAFRGSKRRAEILGEARGVLFIDDYAHHPTAIKSTLEGMKAFYPERRLIVSFMPHTYSRTAALLDEFAGAFSAADTVILHKIYASARESAIAGVDGRALFERTRARHPCARYFEEPLETEEDLIFGDGGAPRVFITMGAGDNWKLGRLLYEKYREER